MQLKLSTFEKSWLLMAIKNVLETGESWEDKGLHYPVENIVNCILTIKGMECGFSEDYSRGFETNGWQYDWWQHFIYNNKKYVLTGSGYYGGHSFSLDESPEKT